MEGQLQALGEHMQLLQRQLATLGTAVEGKGAAADVMTLRREADDAVKDIRRRLVLLEQGT